MAPDAVVTPTAVNVETVIIEIRNNATTCFFIVFTYPMQTAVAAMVMARKTAVSKTHNIERLLYIKLSCQHFAARRKGLTRLHNGHWVALAEH